jgi:hypothetical protein
MCLNTIPKERSNLQLTRRQDEREWKELPVWAGEAEVVGIASISIATEQQNLRLGVRVGTLSLEAKTPGIC